MSRSLNSTGLAMAVVVGFALSQVWAYPQYIHAQDGWHGGSPTGQANWFADKELAREMFAVSQRPLSELLLARVRTARDMVADYWDATTIVDLMDDPLGQLPHAYKELLEAELAAVREPVQQLVAMENYWHALKRLEKIRSAEVAVGKRPFAEAAQARFYRLEAEILLIQMHKKLKNAVPNQIIGGLSLPQAGINPLNTREHAEELFDLSQQNLQDLYLARVPAAREFMADYHAKVRAGILDSDQIDDLLSGSKDLLAAELAVAKGATRRLAALESYQRALKEVEMIRLAEAKWGKRPNREVTRIRFHRLGADIALLQERQQQKDSGAEKLSGGLVLRQSGINPLQAKDLARDLFEQSHPELQDLLLARLQAVREFLAEYERSMTLGILETDQYPTLLIGYKERLEAELSVFKAPSRQRVALEKYCALKRLEAVRSAEVRGGRGWEAIPEAARTRFYRLSAEIAMRQGQQGLNRFGGSTLTQSWMERLVETVAEPSRPGSTSGGP